MQELPSETNENSSAVTKSISVRLREFLTEFSAFDVALALLNAVIAAYVTWQKSREAAVFQLVVVTVSSLRKEKSPVKFSFTIVSVVAVFAFIVYAVVEPPQVVGWLQPASEPTPSNICGALPQGSVIAMTGNFATVIEKANWKTGIVKLGSCELLSIAIGDNGASIDAVLYSNDSRAGEIHDNKFSINEGGYIIERTADLSTLIVHDKNNVEVIYVRYLNENAFRIRGVFSCPSSVTKQVVITNTHFPFMGEGRGCGRFSRYVVDLQ